MMNQTLVIKTAHLTETLLYGECLLVNCTFGTIIRFGLLDFILSSLSNSYYSRVDVFDSTTIQPNNYI